MTLGARILRKFSISIASLCKRQTGCFAKIVFAILNCEKPHSEKRRRRSVYSVYVYLRPLKIRIYVCFKLTVRRAHDIDIHTFYANAIAIRWPTYILFKRIPTSPTWQPKEGEKQKLMVRFSGGMRERCREDTRVIKR